MSDISNDNLCFIDRLLRCGTWLEKCKCLVVTKGRAHTRHFSRSAVKNLLECNVVWNTSGRMMLLSAKPAQRTTDFSYSYWSSRKLFFSHDIFGQICVLFSPIRLIIRYDMMTYGRGVSRHVTSSFLSSRINRAMFRANFSVVGIEPDMWWLFVRYNIPYKFSRKFLRRRCLTACGHSFRDFFRVWSH